MYVLQTVAFSIGFFGHKNKTKQILGEDFQTLLHCLCIYRKLDRFFWLVTFVWNHLLCAAFDMQPYVLSNAR